MYVPHGYHTLALQDPNTLVTSDTTMTLTAIYKYATFRIHADTIIESLVVNHRLRLYFVFAVLFCFFVFLFGFYLRIAKKNKHNHPFLFLCVLKKNIFW